IIWVAVGYSLALTPGGLDDDARGWIGGKGSFFLEGLGEDSMKDDFPKSVWITFQMTFA
ncbi:MAG TPA: ammonia channel protein, partial [Opitutae bacterium]|nr:ammonia channel protein [Opitutae bacterium]